VNTHRHTPHRFRHSSIRSARQWIENNRATVVIVAGALCALALGAVIYLDRPVRPEDRVEAISVIEAPADDESMSEDNESKLITVHVVGSVVSPGVYSLPADARAIDAVLAAGGFCEDGCRVSVNMAQELFDGAQVRIPTITEAQNASDVLNFGVLGADGTPVGSAYLGGAPNAGASTLININTADAALLETLPGIGPSTSAKIIADRSANGPYRSVSDLTRVSGIGEKKIEALLGLIEAK